MLQGGTRPDDLLKVHLAANLFFEIQLFLRKLVLESGDLAVGKRVFNCNGDLPRDHGEKLTVVGAERVFLPPAETQNAKRSPPVNQRNETDGLQSFASNNCIFLGSNVARFDVVQDDWLESRKSFCVTST